MEYSTKQKISSCTVSKELIASIEKYLNTGMINSLAFTGDELSMNYEVKIEDQIGAETYESIESYAPLGFIDTINRISLAFSMNNKKTVKQVDSERFTIEISFSNLRMFSEISIRTQTANAKDKAIMVLNNINSLILPFQLNRGIYHSPFFAFIMTSPMITYSFANSIVKNGLYSLLIIAPLLSLLFFLFAFFPGLVKPYCDFNTRRQKIINKYFSFFYWGSLGFFVFNVLYKFFWTQVSF